MHEQESHQLCFNIRWADFVNSTNYLEPEMYYNCGTAIAKRQTKLKLHFTIHFSVFALSGLQKLISHDFSLTTLQFPDFSRFSRRVVTLYNVHGNIHSSFNAGQTNMEFRAITGELPLIVLTDFHPVAG